MTTIKVKPMGWGCETEAYTAKAPGYLTPREAALALGLATITFNRLARKMEVHPKLLAGTHNHKYSVYLFSPEQVRQLDECRKTS